MKSRLSWKIISFLLIITTLMAALPLSVFAEETGNEAEALEVDIYIKSVKLAEAKTREEAKSALEDEGYVFLEGDLNEGTGENGIWMGYTSTTDPTEAIYDLVNLSEGALS